MGMEQTLLMEPHVCEELWRRHADRLLLYAAALLADRPAAEDVLQNVFVRLLAAGGPPEVDSPASYLFRAVRNEALNALRSRRPRGPVRLFETGPDPLETAERAEWGRRVEAVLGALEGDEREAVVLKIWGDLSFSEGAAVAGVSEKAFEHRYYRGLAALKEKLGGSHE
jgi:RNA polymerase sigma-70 factor (ECF subfamily)